MKKLIVSCGGTGGHFYPGLSIAREALRQKYEVRLFLTGKRAQGQKTIAASHGLQSDLARALSLPRKIWQVPKFLFCFAIDYTKARKYLKLQKPDAILFMGSFAGVPLGLACAHLKIPLFVHEGNVWAGKANRFLAKYANKFLASFPLANESSINSPIVVTGMPIRPELQEDEFADSELLKDMNKEDPLLLVFGGSQGAQAINSMLPHSYEVLRARKYSVQLIHLSGLDDNREAQDFYEDYPVKVTKQSDEMGALLNRADVVVCRAGASSIAELIHFRKKTVLIPYPIAAENHQEINADFACKSELFYKLHQNEIDKFSLANAIELQLRQDKKGDVGEISYPDAAKKVLKEIFS